jgi:hypothetical protein
VSYGCGRGWAAWQRRRRAAPTAVAALAHGLGD